jgi:hypothetical protein
LRAGKESKAWRQAVVYGNAKKTNDGTRTSGVAIVVRDRADRPRAF